MGEISIREMRRLLASLEERLEKEGEIMLPRRGKPIARILPVRKAAPRRPSHADLRAAMKRSETGSEAYVREDRDAR